MKLVNKKIIILVLVLAFLLLFSAPKTFALEVNWPSSPGGTELTEDSTLPILTKYIYEWGIALGALAAFAALIMGGFMYLTSAGDPSKMSAARERVVSAVFGLVLLLGSWILLNTINPALTKFHTPKFAPKEWAATTTQDYSFMEPCDFAYLWEGANYKEEGGISTPGLCLGSGCKEEKYKIEKFYSSIKCFTKCTDDDLEKDEKREEAGLKKKCKYLEKKLEEPGHYKLGGSCTIQLFKMKITGWLPGFKNEYPCGSLISEVHALHPDLTQVTDRKVTCMRLIQHNVEEYKPESVEE